jgi:hypothetical protein
MYFTSRYGYYKQRHKYFTSRTHVLYKQIWVYFTSRDISTLKAETRVLYKQRWVYFTSRDICTLRTDVQLYTVAGVHEVTDIYYVILYQPS